MAMLQANISPPLLMTQLFIYLPIPQPTMENVFI